MENNLSLYRIFHTTATIGNISTAAKLLYISQPAVSKAISKLEQNLNTALFIRTPKGVTLTYEGELLFEHTRIAFDALSLGENQLQRSIELGGGHIRIGVSTTLCKFVLLPYLKEFISDNPYIKISIECQSTYRTLQLLDAGKVDIGLIGKPENAKECIKNQSFCSIGDIEDIFVTTQSYLEHLKIRESGAAPFLPTDTHSIFQNATLMLLDKENMTRQYIDSFFAEQRINPNQLIEVTTMDLLIDFAKIGLGIACVIKDFVKEELHNGTLIQISSEVPIPARTIGFAYAPENTSSSAINRFISYVMK